MHYSRLCAVLIDCKTADLDEAARFWAAALGRPVDLGRPRASRSTLRPAGNLEKQFRSRTRDRSRRW